MNEFSSSTEGPPARAQSGRLLLRRGSAVALRDRKGARLHVVSGMVWITQDGDQRDLFVSRGGQFDVERAGITVVYALKSSEVCVEAPPRQPRWSFVGSFFASSKRRAAS